MTIGTTLEETQRLQKEELHKKIDAMAETMYGITDAKNYKDPVFVGVNGRTYLVERGVTVSVPRMVAEVIERSEAQKQKAEAFISDVVSRSQSI